MARSLRSLLGVGCLLLLQAYSSHDADGPVALVQQFVAVTGRLHDDLHEGSVGAATDDTVGDSDKGSDSTAQDGSIEAGKPTLPPMPEEVVKGLDIAFRKAKGDQVVWTNITRELQTAWARELQSTMRQSVESVGKRQAQMVEAAGQLAKEGAQSLGDTVGKWLNENVKTGKVFTDYFNKIKSDQEKMGALGRKWLEKNTGIKLDKPAAPAAPAGGGNLMLVDSHTSEAEAEASAREAAAEGAVEGAAAGMAGALDASRPTLPPVPEEFTRGFDIAYRKAKGDQIVWMNITRELQTAWVRELQTVARQSVEGAFTQQAKLMEATGQFVKEGAQTIGDSVTKWFNENVKNGKVFTDQYHKIKTQNDKIAALGRKWLEKNTGISWENLFADKSAADKPAAGNLLLVGSRTAESSAQGRPKTKPALPPLPEEVMKGLDVAIKKAMDDSLQWKNMSKELQTAFHEEMLSMTRHNLESIEKHSTKLVEDTQELLSETAKTVGQEFQKWVDNNIKTGKVFTDYANKVKTQNDKVAAAGKKWLDKYLEKNSGLSWQQMEKLEHILGVGQLQQTGARTRVAGEEDQAGEAEQAAAKPKKAVIPDEDTFEDVDVDGEEGPKFPALGAKAMLVNMTQDLQSTWKREAQVMARRQVEGIKKAQSSAMEAASRMAKEGARNLGQGISKWLNENIKSGKVVNGISDWAKSKETQFGEMSEKVLAERENRPHKK